MPKRTFWTLAVLLAVVVSPLAAAPVSVKEPTEDTPDEVEQIRKQLGPEFSIESKEFEIEFERRGEGHRNSSAFGPGQPAPDKAAQMNERLRAMSQATRDQARHLELMAAEAEMKMEYELADRLRDVARRQWESARFMRAPLDYPPHPVHGLGPQRIPPSNPNLPKFTVPAFALPPTQWDPIPKVNDAPHLAPRREPPSGETPEITTY